MITKQAPVQVHREKLQVEDGTDKRRGKKKAETLDNFTQEREQIGYKENFRSFINNWSL